MVLQGCSEMQGLLGKGTTALGKKDELQVEAASELQCALNPRCARAASAQLRQGTTLLCGIVIHNVNASTRVSSVVSCAQS